MLNLNESPGFSREAALTAARTGQAEAVGELLESYRAYLRMLATSQLRGRLAARISPSDVVQEAMLAAHRGFGDFRGESSAEFSAWMRKILSHKLLSTINRHLNLKRDARREVSMNVTDGRAADCGGATLAGLLSASDPSPSAILTLHEDSQLVARLMQQLPEHYRTVITLRNQRGWRFEQIAEQLERSPLAARLLWLRAIAKLRQLYEAEVEDA